VFNIKHFIYKYLSSLYSHLPIDNVANESYRPFSQRMFIFRNSRLFDKHKLRPYIKSGRVSERKWLNRYQYWKNCEVDIAIVQAMRCRNLHEESGQTPISRKMNSIEPSMVLVGIILFFFFLYFSTDWLIPTIALQSQARNRRRCNSQFYHTLAEKKVSHFRIKHD